VFGPLGVREGQDFQGASYGPMVGGPSCFVGWFGALHSRTTPSVKKKKKKDYKIRTR